MKTKTISFELPLGVFSALRKTPEELKNDIRIVAAVKWYEMGQISQEKASEIAGLCRVLPCDHLHPRHQGPAPDHAPGFRPNMDTAIVTP